MNGNQIPAGSREDKKELALNFLREMHRATFIEHDPARIRTIAERDMVENYVQHSADYGVGREGFIAKMSSLAQELKGKPPFPAPDILFAGVDGDLVVWVSRTKRPDPKNPTSGPLVTIILFNMVRIENGQLAEHWNGQ